MGLQVRSSSIICNCRYSYVIVSCSFPAKIGNLLVVGIDVFHDPTRKGSSIAGVVSSTNATMSKWHSSTVFQTPGQELVDCLKVAFVKALRKYHQVTLSFRYPLIL